MSEKEESTSQPEEEESPAAGPAPEDAGTEDTISLLELMAEQMGDAAPPPQPSPPADEEPTAPPVFDLSGSEEETGTVGPIPDQLPGPPPRPLFAQDLKPVERPLEEDQEATRIAPEVAFPGRSAPAHGEETSRAPAARRPPAPPGERAQPGARPRLPVSPQRRPAARPGQARPPVRVVVPADARRQQLPKPKRSRNASGCLARLVIISLLLAIASLALATIGLTAAYISIASQLPAPGELRSRASSFETARLFDSQGGLLYELADPNAGNRTYVPLDQISQSLIDATIATEDSRFYTNPGFDPIGILRAVYQAAQEGEFVSGASTITQQLARALLLDEEERTERTFSRKVKEIVLAAELFRTYPKDEILELYLNEINYGNRSYGIEAAAQTYFHKNAADLTLSEASLLAGLPQAPALWDPYTAPDRALNRQREVLGLMVAQNMITLSQAEAALDESNIVVYNLTPPRLTINHPHFALTALQQLEELIGSQAIYRGGLRVFTTLDPATQQLAEATLANQRQTVANAGANNAALVAVEPGTGKILALVGSLDYHDEAISGQVNMALQPRQPGSAIKPLVYLTALEQGWTPATLIWDVETAFPDGTNPPYVPKNYDDEFHGPLRLRLALGNSYNIPAIKALEFVGVCPFLNNIHKLGVSLRDDGCEETGLPRNVGLSLAVGGGAVSPLEMASAFSTLGNGGHVLPPFTIQRIEDRNGNVVYQQPLPDPASSQLVRPEHAYLLGHILSDNDARQPEFGQNNLLVIAGHTVAAKTGTSGSRRDDVRDGWTIGYTPQIAVAVWVGNTDNEVMADRASGYGSAAPIWHDFMSSYLADKPPAEFDRPAGVEEIEVCADSGTRPGPACGQRVRELFAQDQPPLGADQDLRQQLPIDLWTHQVANAFCQESVYEASFVSLLVSGREEVQGRERQLAQQWLESTPAGRSWAAAHQIPLPLRLPPAEQCQANTPRPRLGLIQPVEGQSVPAGILEIAGTATAPNLAGYRLEFGLSPDPEAWGLIEERAGTPVENGLLARWDATPVRGGPLTIRLLLFGPDNPYTAENDPVVLESRVHLNLLAPTATATPTPTETATPTETPTATPTLAPTSTATLPATETATPAATETTAPPATATATATETPTVSVTLVVITPPPTLELPTPTPAP